MSKNIVKIINTEAILSDPIVVSQPKSISPIIISIPHGGVVMPQQFVTKQLLISTKKLWSDWYTADLYSFLPELGVTVLKTQLSRFVADVNRDETTPTYGPFWKGIVPSTTPAGKEIYSKKLTSTEIKQRIVFAYNPYHKILRGLVSKALKHFDKVLVLDLHSFGMPVTADIVVGDSHGRTARESCVVLLEDILTSNGLTSKRNEPFSGGWIVRQFIGNNSVDAVQLELNQRLYLNSDDANAEVAPPRQDKEKFLRTQLLLKQVFTQISENYRKL